ncbi:MAG: DUF4303 domain-containing protein [Deltaproteobacteria bacterium]|nr:DUF4303 domain-containing protein [Nannocystaceae bacterium]
MTTSRLFHVGCTAKYAAEHELHDVRFLPNEWIQNGDVDPPALNVAAEVLRVHAEHAPGSTWAAARDAAFCALVTGLAAARVEGRVDDSTFLTVISTDPSEHMEELEETSLALLNSPSVVREWREWRLAEAEAWLHEFESKPEPLSYADQDRVAQLRAETRRFQSLLHR